MSKGRLLFVATEDWFVRSHFLPMVRRARRDGWRVLVAARMGEAEADLRAAGAETIALDHARADNSASGVLAAARELGRVFRRLDPHVIHAIALKPAFLAAVARGQAPRAGLIYAMTGLGHLGVSVRPHDLMLRGLVLRVIAMGLRSRRAALAVENADDLALLARLAGRAAASRAVLLPGAGVDPQTFAPGPFPPAPPVRIGFASRLVRSKGLDVLVAAFERARASGAAMELHVAGVIDPANPGALEPVEVEALGRLPGVKLHGRVSDMPAFWRDVHVACVPTRGGEGLPRALIEAAACGRPAVVTRVAGCREFVAPGETGLIVPPADPAALAQALSALAADAGLRERMGAAARTRVLSGYTEDRVADLAAAAWSRVAQAAAHKVGVHARLEAAS